jgi:hypothetical protein
MNRRTGSLMAAITLATSMPALAQWLHYPTPGIPRAPDGKANLSAPAPKTTDGKPDLTGLWRNNSKIDSDLKPEDVQPWAQAAARRSAGNLQADFWTARCLPPGPLFGFLDLTKIVQAPGLIVILSEAANLYRQIFMDGRALPEDPNPSWQGYSVGHWDGDALLVETIGFNDKNPVDYSLHPHTEALRLTERYRRPDFGHIELQITFDDPKAFTRSWTMKTQLQLEPDTELLEFVCLENEKDRKHFVITEQDRKEIHLDSTLLSKYAGTYELPRPGREPVILTVSVAGDQLIYETPAMGKLPLFAQSQTVFVSTIGPVIEFVNDDHGAVSHLIVHAAEGEQKAVRRRDAPARPR